MRTTLALQDDALKVLRVYAKERRLSMGKAASELIQRGARYQPRIRMVNGFPVLDLPDDVPMITNERVRELLNEE
jgi:hypothetical protein